MIDEDWLRSKNYPLIYDFTSILLWNGDVNGEIVSYNNNNNDDIFPI